MQDVIHRVMEAEKEAQRILQAARTEAERLVNEAHQQARANEERARIEVRRAADELIERAVQAAVAEKAARLSRTVLELESGVQLSAEVRRCAVTAVVDCVAGQYLTG